MVEMREESNSLKDASVNWVQNVVTTVNQFFFHGALVHVRPRLFLATFAFPFRVLNKDLPTLNHPIDTPLIDRLVTPGDTTLLTWDVIECYAGVCQQRITHNLLIFIQRLSNIAAMKMHHPYLSREQLNSQYDEANLCHTAREQHSSGRSLNMRQEALQHC
jgi:hypothetical protein